MVAVAYLAPTDLVEALEMVARPGCTILAGGTDFYPARVGSPLDDDVVDITGVDGLRGITAEDGVLRIGALTTWSEVARVDLPPGFRSLQQAARQIGGVQVQNVGTVGGNLCNSSPAADGIPPLLTLDARVELMSAGRTRVLALDEFLIDYRKTAIASGEILTAVLVPPLPVQTFSTFLKLGARRYLVISIAMVAAALSVEAGTVTRARVAIGACSPVAVRARDLEESLIGREPSPTLAEVAAPRHLEVLSPIDDVRAPASYRREAALTLVRRALAECGEAL